MFAAAWPALLQPDPVFPKRLCCYDSLGGGADDIVREMPETVEARLLVSLRLWRGAISTFMCWGGVAPILPVWLPSSWGFVDNDGACTLHS